MALYLIRNLYFGRTSQYILKELNWLNYFQLHENSITKLTYQLINSSEDSDLKYQLIENRSIRNKSQNKCGPHRPEIGWSNVSQNSFLYKSKTVYNQLPQNITLSPTFAIFKKWIKKYTLNNEVKIPARKDNENEDTVIIIDQDNIINCRSF